MNGHCLAAVISRMTQASVQSRLSGALVVRACSVGLSTSVALASALWAPLQAKPAEQNSAGASSVLFDKVDSQSSVQSSLEPTLAQAATPTVQERPGTHSKIEETAKKKGKPSIYGTVTKPGFFAVVEQTTAWNFPRAGAAWGTGAGAGATFVGFGVSGNIRGSTDNLLSWSAQLGPLFQHTYNVPSIDATPLRMDVSATLSPGRGDDLNIYVNWRGVAGDDVLGETRLRNTVRAGVVYSFAGSRIVPDVIELINLPEKGFYARVEPAWFFSPNGQLTLVQTQAYVGLSETWYPFTFAVEVGPQFVQTASRELQTNLGGLLDFGYLINSKMRAYVRYRPGLSCGGNVYPAASQILQAGVNYRF